MLLLQKEEELREANREKQVRIQSDIVLKD